MDKDNDVEIDTLAFIQQLNYKFNYAKQKSDQSITYVQASTLTDVHQDLKPYVFKSSSLLHVASFQQVRSDSSIDALK